MIDRRQKFTFLELVLAKSLSVEQAARHYDCHPRTIRRWCWMIRADARGSDGRVREAEGIGFRVEIANDVGHRGVLYLRLRRDDV
jgi:transposase-like protein